MPTRRQSPPHIYHITEMEIACPSTGKTYTLRPVEWTIHCGCGQQYSNLQALRAAAPASGCRLEIGRRKEGTP